MGETCDNNINTIMVLTDWPKDLTEFKWHIMNKYYLNMVKPVTIILMSLWENAVRPLGQPVRAVISNGPYGLA